MMTLSDKRFSLQLILAIPFALILVVSAGLIAYLNFQNGIDSAHELSQQLLMESSIRVQENLDSYFSIPQLLIEQNLSAIRLNYLDLNNGRHLQQHFLAQMLSYEGIKAIVYASEEGEMFGPFRSLFGAEFILASVTVENDFTLLAYEVNREGEIGNLLHSRLNHTPRTRTWYQTAILTGEVSWTPIYSWVGNFEMAVDVVAPVYAETGELLGVMDVSVGLSLINEFLRDISVNQGNQIFIVDEMGLLVASSTLAQPYTTVNGGLQRFDTVNVNDSLIQNASQRLIQEFGAWSGIQRSQQFDFEIAGERRLAQVSPFQLGGLHWWIVASKPEASYTASINQHIQGTLGLTIALLLGSIILISMVSRWISRPITQLTQVTKSFASGNWSERIQIHRGDEIGQLATSFNLMAEALQTSVAELQASEARLRAIFENSSDAILMSQNGIHIKANPAYFKMFGYEAKSLVGKSILDVIAPDERNRIAEYIHLRSIGGDAPSRYEALGLRQNGSIFDIEIHVSTFYQNTELYSLSIFRDISERKKAQTALIQQTHELTERLKELNCLYEHSKILERTNISVEELCQETVNLIPSAWQYPSITVARITVEGQSYTTANFKASSWKQSSPIIVDNQELGRLEVAYLEERPMDYEGPFLKEERLLIDELARRLAHKIKALHAEADLKQYHETLEKKVIERTQDLIIAEMALRKALATEKELGELKTRFVSVASHEFRTPLASILALSETLSAYRHKLPEAEIEECLEQIKGQVVHLKNLVEEVLLLTRMQARRQEFNPVRQNIHALLQSLIHEFRKHPNTKHPISYSSNQENAELLLDTKLMRQLMSNLLSNAMKYSNEDKPIEISLECSDDLALISIRDYGIGIPENDIKHLFEPFHRASNVGIISGTGLGLVIAKESVELHHGTITVESQVNQGTIFRVYIPILAEKAKQNDENTGD